MGFVHPSCSLTVAGGITTASVSFSADTLVTWSCSAPLGHLRGVDLDGHCVHLLPPPPRARHDVMNRPSVAALVPFLGVFCCNCCAGAAFVLSRVSAGPGCSTCMFSDLSHLSGLASPSCWSICTSSGFASAFLVSLLDLACDVELLPSC